MTERTPLTAEGRIKRDAEETILVVGSANDILSHSDKRHIQTARDCLQLLATLAAMTAERDAAVKRAEEASRALESLTPSGSEFHDSPKMCAGYIRERLDSNHRNLIRFKTDRDAALAESARLAEIVGRLPKTADGVVVAPGHKVWTDDGDDGVVCLVVSYEGGYDGVRFWYSTREAAEAARGSGGEGKS